MSFKREIFGLDISDFSIEAMLLSKRFGRTKVKAYGRKTIVPDLITNGKILKSKLLAKEIREVLKKAKPHPIHSIECVISLPESRVFTHVFQLPLKLKRKQIQNTLPFEAEKVIPITSSEVNFDFKVLTKEREGQEVFYAATQTSTVDDWRDVLFQAGLEPVALDLESSSLARALIKNYKQPTLLVDVGARTTNVSVVDRMGIRFSSIIQLGGEGLTQKISKQLKISEEEAEKLKRKNGFSRKDQGKVFLVIQQEWGRVIHELKQIIDFYQSSYSRPIQQMVLAGGTSLLPNIASYFKDNLDIKTVIGDPFVKIGSSDVDLKNQAVLYSNVVGLALRGLWRDPGAKGINLLKLKAKRFKVIPTKQERVAWRQVYMGAVALIVFGLVLIGFLYARSRFQFLFQPQSNIYEQLSAPQTDIDFEKLDQLRQDTSLTSTSSPSDPVTTSPEEIEPESEENVNDILGTVVVDQNTVGYLNVRSGPNTANALITQLDIGDELPYLEESSGWLKVLLDDGQMGWVSGLYVTKQ